MHDLGYIGKASMDDEDGETHPKLGASIMKALFDREPYDFEHGKVWTFKREERDTLAWYLHLNNLFDDGWIIDTWDFLRHTLTFKRPRYRWYDFVLLHSRFYAKKLGKQFSRLCVADKLAICLTPGWLYLPMVRATGEIHEYMGMTVQNGNSQQALDSTNKAHQREWHTAMQAKVREWVELHKDGRADTVTPANRHQQTVTV